MKIIKFFLIFIVIIILTVILILGYFGFVPGVSAIFGSDKPRDLGVTHTEEDLNSAQQKLSQELVDADPGRDPNEQLNSAVANPVDTALSQEEYSAHVERVHPINDVQVKFDGSNFEMSGRIAKSRIPQFVRTLGFDVSDAEVLEAVNTYLPFDPIFYMAGSGSAANGKVNMNLERAELGRLPVSKDQAEQYVEAYMELVIDQIPAFSAESVTLENSELKYRGTAPNQLPRY